MRGAGPLPYLPKAKRAVAFPAREVKKVPTRKGRFMANVHNAPAMGRRAFLGMTAAGALAVAGSGLIGCSPAQKDAEGEVVADAQSARPEYALTPGTYSATVKGMVDEFQINTLVSSNAIVKVEVANSSESAEFGAKALKRLTQEVVDKQYADVDTVAGATMTSMAFKTALKDCLAQAGDENAFSVEPDVPAPVEQTLSTDVVVVGSGISGQAAALAAAQKGARVIMLEKLGVTGGAATGSGGAILAAGTPLQNEADGNTDPKGLADFLYRFSEEQGNYELISKVANESAGIVQWYMDLGVEFELGNTGGSAVQYSHRAINPGKEVIPSPPGPINPGMGGHNIFNKTYPAFLAAGGTCLVNTRATELIQDESGAVAGVKASDGAHEYTIECAAVVLAAGGYEGDKSLFEQWSPKSHFSLVDSFCHVGDTGDGIQMGIDAGGYFVGGGWAQTNGSYSPIPAIRVTTEGKRYFDEMSNQDLENYGTQLMRLYDSGSEKAFTLIDSAATDEKVLEALEKAQKNGKAVEGESIKAVAEAAGVDAAGLQETVDKWNSYVAAGEDPDFGSPVEAYGTYTQAPFYLIPYSLVVNGTVGGLKIDLDSRVLSEGGKPIPGLFAAGETCNGEYEYRLYPSGGGSLLFGSVTGKNAGENAAALVA